MSCPEKLIAQLRGADHNSLIFIRETSSLSPRGSGRTNYRADLFGDAARSQGATWRVGGVPSKARLGDAEMTPQESSLWLQVNQVDEATIVRFTVQRLLKERTIETIGEQLTDLVETQGCRRLVLDFRNVEAVMSTMVGKLVALNEKTQTLGGRLVLCNVGPGLYEVFQSLQLPQRLSICSGEQEALQRF
jgi:anti-anti-sigma factor